MAIELDNYQQSHSFLKLDDYSWANVAIFLLAKVLDIAFRVQDDVGRVWGEVEEQIEEWRCGRPDSFNALSVYEGMGARQGAFPEIWMLGASNGI